MSLVVCGIHPSVRAAYRVKAEEMNLSTAVYDKLNGVETTVSSAILRETAIPLASLIDCVGVARRRHRSAALECICRF